MKYINFNQLRSFHAVSKTGSITKAAKLLLISQPTITKQIQSLEEYYSINLINRHARGISLTDLGAKLYEITSGIFELEESAISLFSSNLNIHAGTLNTGTSGSYFIIKLIKEFKKLHPAIKLNVISTNSNDVLEKINNYQIDIGVIGKSSNFKFKSNIHSIPYLKQKILLIVGRGNKFFNRKKINLSELNDCSFINREKGSETRRVFENFMNKNKVHYNSIMEVGRVTMIQAVKENMGIGYLSEPEFQNYKDIKKIELDDNELYTQAYIVYLKKKNKDNLIKAFINSANKIIDPLSINLE